MAKFKMIGPQFGWTDYVCTCCEKKLNPEKTVWLELDQRTNTYHDNGDVPEEKSQGWFPFGKKCAQNIKILP